MAEGNIGTENITDVGQETKTSLVEMPTQQEAGVEQQRFTIPIVDIREQPFPEQTESLQKRLSADGIDIALFQAWQILGEYAFQKPQDLAIKIIPGDKIGSGQVIKGEGTNFLIDLEMPTPEQVEQVRQQPHPQFGVLPNEQYNSIFMATQSSTILHEGVHGLLDSRPDSQFAKDLEKTSGISNQYGQVASLLDEGMAYAIQGLYAQSIEPVGSLAPQANPTDSFMEQTRKALGERLRPILAEYMQQGKMLNATFFAQSGKMLKQFDIEKYIVEYKKKHDQQ